MDVLLGRLTLAVVASAVATGVILGAVGAVGADGVKEHADGHDLPIVGYQSLDSMVLGADLALEDLAALATRAVPTSSRQHGRTEQYIVVRGVVLRSRIVERPDLVPRMWPYVEHRMKLEEHFVLGAERETSGEIDVVTLWSPRFAAGEVVTRVGSELGDLGVPLSAGMRTMAVGIRNDGSGNGAAAGYRAELWPAYHIVFALIGGEDGSWAALMPVARRSYDDDVARRSSEPGVVPLEAWHGELRRVAASGDEIFDVLLQVAKEASER